MNLCRVPRHQTGEKPKNRSSQKKQQVCSKSCGKIYRHFRKIHSAWKLSANTQRLQKLLQKNWEIFVCTARNFIIFKGVFVIFHIKGFISPVPNTNFFDCIFHFFSNDAPQNLVSAMILAQNQKKSLFLKFSRNSFLRSQFFRFGVLVVGHSRFNQSKSKKLQKS